jgi:hypothetical protein
MPLHPELPVRRILDSRRTPAASGPPPTRNPRRHGAGLNAQLQAVRQTRRLPVGIDPDLVFKVKAANTRLNDDALSPRGLIPLGETADYLYFVMARDEGNELAAALQRYSGGPDQDGAKGPLYTLFDRVEAIEPYGPEDRRGPGLDDLDPSAQPHVVDVSIWPSETWNEAQRRSNVVIDVVNLTQGSIVHQAIGPRRSVLRVSVNDEGLGNLLGTSVIERIRTPPVPFIDPSDWRDVDIDDLVLQTQSGVAVGVLDDEPAAGHPLLTGLIGSVIEVGPTGHNWPAPGNHGTQVAGRVLLPRLAEELRDHSAITAVGTIHVARILEPVPGRPDETRFAGGDAGLLPHEAVQRAITGLHENHDIRVFNLSFGLREPFDAIHVSELTEVIDDLARDLDIVVVVPTGNARVYGRSKTESGHHAQRDYPAYLGEPEHRLAEPGPAALALTVGALAHSDAPAAQPQSSRLRDSAIAGIDQLAPFSRTGPGIGTSPARLNKPDLVADGGNWVHDGDLDEVIPEDPGVGVITAALGTTGRLFRAACGTSFAAPAAARCAADVLAAYPGSSANFVRALVAMSAREPAGAQAINDVTLRCRLYGLGRPDSPRAVESGSQRVTMTFDGDMAVDTVVIHPIPVPELFAQGRSATRTVQVALAFDPPVRRQRREYLAGAMQLDLYRAIDIDDLVDIVSRQDPDDPNPPIRDRRRVAHLKPGVDSFRSSTLQLRTWEARQLDVNDGETYLLAVTHRTQTWARNTDYERQAYALAVTIADEARTDINLFSLVTQRIELPARVRVRA